MIRYLSHYIVWNSGFVLKLFIKNAFLVERFVDCWSFQMSLTIQQIILDAKRLAGRLKDRENEADTLLTETQTAYRQIYTIKQVRLNLTYKI